MITLRTLRAEYPSSFHPNQDWFEGEAFMDRELVNSGDTRRLVAVRDYPMIPAGVLVPPAVVLAHLYLSGGTPPIWDRYIWTSDLDQHSQHVYVGDSGLGFEIHRHLHLTARWGVPIWG